ncbi:MAG TPA: ribosome biogenesis GTPase Der [Terriglobales bacterium]|nr:ribosome biogenesis GTPase Der [Terriglobales bacterium]
MRLAAITPPRPVRPLPVLAIVGRPNVGKSTLFNRLIRERKAIVDDLPGVTRDRNYGMAEWEGRKFQLVDTGGLDSAADGNLQGQIQEQSRRALEEADIILLLLDGKGGLSPADREAVDLLRKVPKPVFVAVNKIDSKRRQENLYEFYRMGLDRLYPISAEHGLGLSELMEAIVARFPGQPQEAAEEAERRPFFVSIVGRPNVGKSTLVNRLLGFERSIVDAVPGTTRDAVDSPFELAGVPCWLVDTAGIRRKARIATRLERYSVNRSLRSVDRGDLIIHVLDGAEGVTDQDAQLLGYAHQRGKAVVLAVNKWDRVTAAGGDAEAYRTKVSHDLSFLEYVPVVFIAATTGYGVHAMLEIAAQVMRAYDKKVSTSAVNQALQQSVQAHAAPFFQGRAVKFFYATQTGTRPPTFTIFVNLPRAVPESYRRYLVHQLREHLDLADAPLRLILRSRRESMKGKKR